MVVTTASKLIGANKDMEHLIDELEEANVEIDRLREELTVLTENYNIKLEQITKLYLALKYDKENPWWKFW